MHPRLRIVFRHEGEINNLHIQHSILELFLFGYEDEKGLERSLLLIDLWDRYKVLANWNNLLFANWNCFLLFLMIHIFAF